MKDVDPVTRIVPEVKSSIWGYQFGARKRFLRIVVALPNHVTMAKGILENFYIPDVSHCCTAVLFFTLV